MKNFLRKELLVIMLLGFSSGLPFLLTLRTLQAWMTESHVDLGRVGMLSLVGLPYTLKFLWAPLFDRYVIPGWGRRRGWLLVTQIGLLISIFCMSRVDPLEHVLTLQILALIVAFFSASQDVVIDAHRRETLPDTELAMGSTFYYYGYRSAMWVSGGLALGLASFISWNSVYLIMAGLGSIGVLTTIWSNEPESPAAIPKTLVTAVVEPLKEFFTRPLALWILGFLFLYKLGDVMAGNMLTPFYLKLGYSKLEIAAIAKTLSLPFTLLGSFVGALSVKKFGLFRALWIFGVLQAIATFWFQVLAWMPHSVWLLGGVILTEDLITSMATAAFLAFIALMTNRRFTATQFALLSSLTGVPRVVLASPTGFMVEGLGWPGFFTICALVAIPGLGVLHWLRRCGLFKTD